MENSKLKNYIVMILKVKAGTISMDELSTYEKSTQISEKYSDLYDECSNILQHIDGIGESVMNVCTLYDNIDDYFSTLKNNKYKYGDYIKEVFNEKNYLINDIKSKKIKDNKLMYNVLKDIKTIKSN